MSTITDGSNYLVSDPSDALLFSVNEHDGARSGQQDGGSQVLPTVPSAESSCVTTKAIEVCLNGVKQVIIVPLALPSNDVTTVSSSTLLPGYPLSSSSSAVSIDSRPDDVRLLAEACVPVMSSTVPSFVKAEVLSAATNGHAQVSTVFTHPTSTAPSQYQLFGADRIPFTNSLVEVPALQNQSTASAQQFQVRTRHMPPTTITPYPSASFVPMLPTPVMPLRSFPPALHMTADSFIEQRGTVPLQTPPQQPFPVSLSLYHPLQASQLSLGLNSFQQVPWTSYSPVQMAATRGRVIDNTSLNNLHPFSQPSIGLPLTSSRVTNYQQFLPSLQRVVTPNFNVNQPQLQDYVHRKRGVYPQPQYSTQGIAVDAGNYRMPQFDPSFLPNNCIAQRPPAVNVNNMRAVYRNTPYPSRGVISSYTLQSNLNSGSSDISRPRVVPTQRLNNGVLRSVTSGVCQMNESAVASIGRKGTSRQLCKDTVNSTRPHLMPLQPYASLPVLSAVYRMTESSGASSMRKESERALNSIRLLCCQPAAGIPISVNPVQSTTLQTIAVAPTAAVSVYAMETSNTPMFSQITAASSYFQPVRNVPFDRQVTPNQSRPLSLPAMAIATSSLQTITTFATKTNCRPTAAVQVSAAVESNSTNYSELDALLLSVSSDITPGSVPSNCSLTSDPSLTNLLSSSADLFLSSASIPAADSYCGGVTESGVVQSRTGVGMETASTQSGDNSNDLGSLPADVMVETTESESLLVSFCDMFERSETAQQHSEQVSSQPMTNADEDSLSNIEQPKDSGVIVNQQKDETARGLQFAKSLGKGQHFAEEMRQRRLEQSNKKRRRAKLTSLEFDDDGNSSDSWHPDSHSESSEYQSPSPVHSYKSSESQSSSHSESSENQTPSSPAHSTTSSKSQSSDDFAVVTRQSRKRLKTDTMSKRKTRSLRRVASAARKRKNSTALISPSPVPKNCTVTLEQLQLQGQHSVNIHHVDSVICCQRHDVVKTAPQRLVSSDSEGSNADCPPIKKLRIKYNWRIIEHSDSSS